MAGPVTVAVTVTVAVAVAVAVTAARVMAATVTAAERLLAHVAVYGVLTENGRLLLMRRAGSGYHDGELSLPAGHLDAGEDVRSALLRELREELRIEADPAGCRLVTVGHRAPEQPADDYIDLFFTVGSWTGTPVIGEPDQCTELRWADPDALPDDVIPYIAEALQAVRRGDTLLVGGWDT
jgi:8-oxo-dGTP diphosphatase